MRTQEITIGTKLERKNNPEWGVFTVTEINTEWDIITITSSRGFRVLDRNEIDQWNILN